MPRPFFRGLSVMGTGPALTNATMRLAEAVLLLERAPSTAELSIHFVPLWEMHKLNFESRGVDKPTDVLTVPGCGSGGFSDTYVSSILFSPDVSEEQKVGTPTRPGAIAQRRLAMQDLGEIYCSVEYIWHRCNSYPSKCLPFHDYMQAALVHAMLHALGYDHDTPERWRMMVRRERLIRERLRVWRRRWPECSWELDGIEFLVMSTEDRKMNVRSV
ncbi:hypothetical protein TRVL_07402 [Trypanosoma vivax]|uniref:rRNA maturation factor n=1 Tax=Trypanosoma vivax (strain Y486) TaxID=1055687 RepID=G0TU13_TRYVY|nr:hypothetical protein TRVL_07402 [Trypanosoma vivax]CCC47446.1 conserved hypothetical protein [Trypanosoma vivax Y486]